MTRLAANVHHPPFRQLLRARTAAIAVVALTALLTLSCGGGGGASSAPVVPTPPPQVAPLQVTTTTLPNATAGQTYSQTMQATGGTPPYTWGMQSGWVFPAGLSMNSSGLVSGTVSSTQCPNTCLSITTRITVTDSGSRSVGAIITMTVIAPLVVPATTLPSSNIGLPLSLQVPVQGGTLPISTALAVGSAPLPSGVTLNNSGRLEGTPAAFGDFSFTVQATDGATPPNIASGVIQLRITNDLLIKTQGFALGVVGQPYFQRLEAVGGTQPYSWVMTTNALPPGLAFDPTGQVQGIPTVANTYYGQGFSVTDSSTPPRTVSRYFNDISIVPSLFFQTASRLPDGAMNVGYPGTISYAGGRTPYTVRMASGGLPPGTFFYTVHQSIGSLSIQGLPTALGDFSFDLEVTDASTPPTVISRTFTIHVNPQLLFTTTSVPDALEGQPYTFTFAASGGVPPFSWLMYTCGGNVCPPGLTLDASTGTFSGTPTREYLTTVGAEVRDSSLPPQSVTKNFNHRTVGLLRLTTSLPHVRVGGSTRMQLAVSGGIPPYSWSLISGQVPSGLAFNPSTAEIVGTPTTVESQNIIVQVSDSGTSFPQSKQQPMLLETVANAGRNDAISTATPLSNGRYGASLSPSDAQGALAPDNDYYQVIANAGAIVTIETFAERLTPSAPTDTVVEIVDSSGTRLTSCNDLSSSHFFFPCVNDDGFNLFSVDSKLYFQVPGAAGTTTTFYVRVLSWDGHARPDYRYEISISGAN